MPRYRIELEIAEGKGGRLERDGKRIVLPPDMVKQGICEWMYRGDGRESYRVGQRFVYPQDIGKLCPWLLGSLQNFIQALSHGGILDWTYEGTPYRKEIDPEGITTEFVRCPDPTAAGIVIKLIRTRLPDRPKA
jgi:uncharacterized repeat protein (TIGR04076 family)